MSTRDNGRGAISCPIHANAYDLIKAYEKLTIDDKKIILEFVDAFHPPNTLFYFLMKESYETHVKRASTGNDKQARSTSVGIESVRNYEIVRAANETNLDNFSEREPANLECGILEVNDYSDYNDDDNSGEYEDYYNDYGDDDYYLEKRRKYKREGGNLHKNQKHGRKSNGKNGHRRVYRLTNSQATNNIESLYRQTLDIEGAFYDCSSCKVEYENGIENRETSLVVRSGKKLPYDEQFFEESDNGDSDDVSESRSDYDEGYLYLPDEDYDNNNNNSNNSNSNNNNNNNFNNNNGNNILRFTNRTGDSSRYLTNIVHTTSDLRCNGLSGFLENAARECCEYLDSTCLRALTFRLRVVEEATEQGELSHENYDRYIISWCLRVDESRLSYTRSAVEKLFLVVEKRKRESDVFFKALRAKCQLKEVYEDRKKRRLSKKRKATDTADGDFLSDEDYGKSNKNDAGQIERRRNRDFCYSDEDNDRNNDDSDDGDDDNDGKHNGGSDDERNRLRLLKSLRTRGKTETTKQRRLFHVRELENVVRYVCSLSTIKVIKLVDFAILNAHDAWRIINVVMDKALTVYDDKKRYPIRDSLTSILFYDEEIAEELIGAENERVYALDRYHMLWQHGLTAKLGNIVSFAISFRRFMRTIVLCCCYFMSRRSTNTRGTVERHRCTFPNASQGIYFNLFMRMQKGHELLCKMTISTKEEALEWLQTLDRLRANLWMKREIPYSRKLEKHLRRRGMEIICETTQNVVGTDERTLRRVESFAIPKESRRSVGARTKKGRND